MQTTISRRSNQFASRSTGLTLLEVVFALALVVFLVSAIMFVYVVALKASDLHGKRSDSRQKIQFALERVIRDVRLANAISVANHAVRFTVYESGSNNSYIYYLYNASDVWPPAYNQTSYDLRRTSLSGGMSGTFTYGNGDLIATGLKPPAADTTMTSSGNVAQIKLVGLEGNETMTVSGYVRPRNG